MFRMFSASVFSLIFIGLTGCSTLKPPSLPIPFDGNYAPVTEYVSRLIENEMQAHKLMGLSVAVIDRGEVIWKQGFGLANVAADTKADTKTLYRAGSVSKLFNAVAVLQLAEQGRFDLDAPIVQYVPEFKIQSRFGATDNITLRMLLSHHAGLPRDLLFGMFSKEPQPFDSLLDQFPSMSVAHEAGTVFSYSNIGVSLSGLAVQKSTALPYEDHLKEQVLDRLNMSASDFTGRLTGERAAAAYINGSLVDELPIRDIPAGGLNTNVEELSQFVQAMLAGGSYQNKKLLNKASVATMLQVQNEGNTLDMGQRIGLGWVYSDEKLAGLYDVVWHTGRTVAHSASVTMVPELDMGVVMLTNSADHTNALSRISNAVLKQLLVARDIPSVEPSPNSVLAKLQPLSDIEGDYVGAYGLVRVKAHEGRLTAQALGMNLVLKEHDNYWYSPKVKLGFITIQPRVIKGLRASKVELQGKQLLVGVEQGRPLLIGEKVESQARLSIWDQRLGDYKVNNASDVIASFIESVSFQYEDGYYLMEYVGTGGRKTKAYVEPISDSTLVILGVDKGETFSYSDNDKAFIFSGLVFEKL